MQLMQYRSTPWRPDETPSRQVVLIEHHGQNPGTRCQQQLGAVGEDGAKGVTIAREQQRHHDKDVQWDAQKAVDLGAYAVVNQLTLEIAHAGPVHAHAGLEGAEEPEGRLLAPW